MIKVYVLTDNNGNITRYSTIMGTGTEVIQDDPVIDMSDIGSIDFKKMGVLYGKDFKMKYALVVTVAGLDSSISVNNIEVTYSSK